MKTNLIAENTVARKVFSKCKLKYSDEGFYYLNPMPTPDDLNKYYSSLYWDSRAGKNYGVNLRDIVHYTILQEYIPQHLIGRKVFLNFGAGHGGISNLLWLRGMDVVNVEPSLLPRLYNERWNTFESINQAADHSVDVLYGSHSLEHVQDIDSFKMEVSRVLKPGGFMFWEVPNANNPGDGAQNGRVDIPHTYYFEPKFFENWLSKSLLCSGFQHSRKPYVIQDWKKHFDDKGNVIRVLGQL